MIMRSRGTGLRIWASILAVYALLLHAPTMAAFGNDAAVVVATGPHAGHGSQSKEVQANANNCCVVCAAGVCGIGPVGTAVLLLPAPAFAARRVRRIVWRRPRATSPHWSRARAPPASR